MHLATGEPLFERIANETADWMLLDMLAGSGGFYSTRDADSEGEEGLFYVWTPEQVQDLLSADSYELFARRFGLNEAANFEGKWHLTVRESIEDLAGGTGRSEEDTASLIDSARQTLLEERSKRVHPARDEKQLTSWNALAIRGFAIAGLALGGLQAAAWVAKRGAGLPGAMDSRAIRATGGRFHPLFSDGGRASAAALAAGNDRRSLPADQGRCDLLFLLGRARLRYRAGPGGLYISDGIFRVSGGAGLGPEDRGWVYRRIDLCAGRAWRTG